LVFFGTPFRGAEGMSQSEMLQAALSEYEQDQVHPEVLNILDPGNELLQDLVDGFGKTRSLPNKAQVACFFELQPSNVGAIVGEQSRQVSTAFHMLPYVYAASIGVFLTSFNRSTQRNLWLTSRAEVCGERELGLP
jgi:hypothetical protein